MLPSPQRSRRVLVAAAGLVSLTVVLGGQVLPSTGIASPSSSTVWERLLKLRTTASLLQTTAHPDDEQGSMLARVGRHDGARTGLLTLNRGEAGDNAIGPELFDGLGLIRTAELVRAGEYYGLDEQYFTAVADYGFSKRLDEALEHWDRQAVLRDMVRAIRRFRPLVVVSRWQGTDRDGHGQHQAAGALTPDAVRLAGDAAAFPELDREGLRPWRVRKVYVAGVREGESWTVRLDTGTHDPVLGASYSLLGRLGLAIQRSQSSGRFDAFAEGQPLFYRRLGPDPAGAREDGFFEGLDVSLPGLYRMLGTEPPDGHGERLQSVTRNVEAALAAFTITNPSAATAPLAHGLASVRQLARDTIDPDARFILETKAQQFEDALAAAAGLSLVGVAEPPGSDAEAATSPFAPPPTFGPATPGQALGVRVLVIARGDGDASVGQLSLTHPGGAVHMDVPDGVSRLRAGGQRSHLFALTLPANAPPTRPYFARATPSEPRYTVVDASLAGRPFAPPPLTASANVRIAGVPLTLHGPVLRREPNLPFGYDLYPMEILPPVSVSVQPRSRIVVRGASDAGPIAIAVVVTSHAARPVDGSVELRLPQGWSSTPARHAFLLAGAGANQQVTFAMTVPQLDTAPHEITAVVTAGELAYTSDVEAIRHRDLPVQYLYRDARALVRGVDVSVAPGLKVGYVMGVGDEVPAAIAQLGATVQLLAESDLAEGDLGRFDTIVTGTRAYAVRADLRAHNARVLEYVKAGGNLVVFYNTPEFTPGTEAPYPASLPQEAEEVCEEAAPVKLLAPGDPLLSRPNRIGSSDFDGWIEQRGSKFFASWDSRYTPLLSTHDRDQPPQRGGMLHAQYGKGHYTYMAYALHRQLPAGVPGAYRLLANLISAGRQTVKP